MINAFFQDPVLGLSVLLDPRASKTFSLDWGAEWLDAGDSVQTTIWSSDAGMIVGSSSMVANVTTVELSCSTPGNYSVTNTVTTAGVAGAPGVTDARTFTVQVREVR